MRATRLGSSFLAVLTLTIAGGMLAAGCSSGGSAKAAAPEGMRPARTPHCVKESDAKVSPAAFVVGPQDDPSIVLMMGGGDKGLVLAPMSNGDNCQWIAQARHFVSEGYHVAALSWSSDRRASVSLAAQLLSHRGAKRIALLGASIGGSAVLDVAASVAPPPVAVVAMSPAVAHAEDLDPLGRIKAYDGPVLVIGDELDSIAPIEQVEQAAAAHEGKGGGEDKLLVLGGSQHGLNIFSFPEGPKALAAIDEFLHSAFA